MTWIDIFHYIRSPSAPSYIHHVSVLLFQSAAWLAFVNRNTRMIHIQLCTFCSCIGGHHCKETARAFSQIKIVRAMVRPKDFRKPSSVSSSAPHLQQGHGWASSHSPRVPANSLHSFSLELSSSSAITLLCMLVPIIETVILVEAFRGKITLKFPLVTKVMV